MDQDASVVREQANEALRRFDWGQVSMSIGPEQGPTAAEQDPLPPPPAERQVQRRLSDNAVAELVDDYRRGESVAQLADRFGLHRTTVMSHLERRGVPLRRNVRKLDAEDVAVAGEHYSRGESLATVGTRFGVDATTIAKELRRAGIGMRARKGWE